MKHYLLILLTSYMVVVHCQNRYILSQQGQSCNEACFELKMNCNPHVVTNNNTDLFAELGVNCTENIHPWWAEDQPSFVNDTNDANNGKCVGYIDVPAGIICSGRSQATQRLCRCDEPSSSPTFGTRYSNGVITTEEKWIFNYVVAPGDVGVLTHFWISYWENVDNGTMIRYYIDGETTASIQFTPSLACGVGYYDTQAPWRTEWFGKGGKDGGWYNNFRIPFQKSIVVTAQHLYGNYPDFNMLIRGSINIPITVGGVVLPKNARMTQTIINATYQPLEWVPLVSVPSGPGAHWMITLSAGSGNLNFLEGCFHAYFDGNTDFPGVVLATSTENYFGSARYFDAGQFRLPVSGFTHLNQTDTYVTWSAYRFHDVDPLFFNNGFQFLWRIGDIYSQTGMKCQMISGGSIAGAPTASEILSYAWVYTWPAS